MHTRSECLDSDRLDELASGRLPDSIAQECMSHVGCCSRCARRLEDCQADLELLRELQAAAPSVPDIRTMDVRSSSWNSGTSSLPAGNGTRGATSPLATDAIPGYRVVREVHRGGQGVVYEAIQLSTKRTVALKVMLEGPFAGRRARWRFEREVRLAASLKHPNIVAIHDSGIAHGQSYYTMDYVLGHPLDTYVRMAGPSLQDAIRIFITVCDAVSYAHRHGIIHRDLKPSNILVDEAGQPQVLDFGLAKLLTGEQNATHSQLATVPGHVLGTLRYMSPEQTRGDLELIDTRTDVYALGVILYELLIGSPPYDTGGDIMAAFTNIREVDSPRPSRLRRDIGSDLDAVILKAMHKEPDRRYSSAEDLKSDLGAWLDGLPVTARSDSSFYVLRKLATRHYFHTSVIVALVASIIAFASISYQAMVRERESAARLKGLNIQFVSHIDSLQQQVAKAVSNQPQALLGYFLLEWGSGRVESAQSIQKLIPSDSPEAAVTRFLMNNDMSLEDLRDVPKMSESLALFALGERLYHAGKLSEAKEAFGSYLDRYGGFYRPLVEARLRQIGSVRESGEP